MNKDKIRQFNFGKGHGFLALVSILYLCTSSLLIASQAHAQVQPPAGWNFGDDADEMAGGGWARPGTLGLYGKQTKIIATRSGTAGLVDPGNPNVTVEPGEHTAGFPAYKVGVYYNSTVQKDKGCARYDYTTFKWYHTHGGYVVARKHYVVAAGAKAAAAVGMRVTGTGEKHYGYVVDTGSSGFNFSIPIPGGASISFELSPLGIPSKNILLDEHIVHTPETDFHANNIHQRGNDAPFFRHISGGVQTYTVSGLNSEAFANLALHARVSLFQDILENQYTVRKAYPFEKCSPTN